MGFKKIAFFLYISFLCTQVISAYQKDFETILLTYPNMDATEYVLILNNSLEKTLPFLDDMEINVDQNKEEDIYKMIRKVHLAYLRIYAYVYHESDMKRWDRQKKGRELLKEIIDWGTNIMGVYPQYSDIRRVVSVSMLISAKLGIQGFDFFVKNRKTAIAYVEEALALNEENYMARVVLNNFDSLAIAVVGAKKQRGYDAISVVMRDTVPKPIQFEFYISQTYAFRHRREYENVKISLNNARKLYPTSWRYKEFKKFIK